MSKWRLLMVGAVVLVACTQAAALNGRLPIAYIDSLTCSAHSSDPNMTYYSGTVGTITARWGAHQPGVPNPPKLTKCEVWLNDVRLYYRAWSGTSGPDTWGPLAGPFSTTQFSNGSTLTFRAHCENSDGLTDDFTFPITKVAWNKAYVLYNSVAGFTYANEAASYVNTKCGNMNHSTSSVVSDHSADSIRSSIPAYGLFYIYTHATSSSFVDCLNAGSVTSGQVTTAVGQKTQSQCPYTFAFVDGCASGDQSLAAHFQGAAGFGWHAAAYDTVSWLNWRKKFWDELAAQNTVGGAANAANAVYHLDAYTVPVGNPNYRVHKTYSSDDDPS